MKTPAGEAVDSGVFSSVVVHFCIVPQTSSVRLDQYLARTFKEYSRSQLQDWVRQGYVLLDGNMPRTRDPVCGRETIIIRVPEMKQTTSWVAQAMPLAVVHEDDDILVLNKPAGLVVHPGAGNPDKTLLNALLSYAPKLGVLPRAGIVHRLDKDTSGLMVIAKTEPARLNLIEQLSERQLHRQYLAVVNGAMISGGTVDASIGRHPRDRKRMAVIERGRPAITHYRVQKRYRTHTQIRVKLETGRTHQIRVHMAHIRFPVTGDPVYGGRLKLPPQCHHELQQQLRSFRRQALHAEQIGLLHPVTGKEITCQVEPPEDLRALLDALETDAVEASRR